MNKHKTDRREFNSALGEVKLEKSVKLTLNNVTDVSDTATLKSSLMVISSLLFAACLVGSFHELGHALVGAYLKTEEQIIHIHVFGLSYTTINGEVPNSKRPFLAAMGPFFDLLLATTLFCVLWRNPKPKHLPLLMWAPFSYLLEGYIIIQGVVDYQSNHSPNSDVGKFLYYTGMSPVIPLIIGIILMIVGCVSISLLLRILNVSQSDTFSNKLIIIAPAMLLFSGLSLVFEVYFEQEMPARYVAATTFAEVMITLIVIAIVVIGIAVIYKPLYPLFDRLTVTTPDPVDWGNVKKSAILASLIIPFEYIASGMILPNFLFVLIIFASIVVIISAISG